MRKIVVIFLFSLFGYLNYGQVFDYCLEGNKSAIEIDSSAWRMAIESFDHHSRSDEKDTVVINPVIIQSGSSGIMAFAVEDFDSVLNLVNDYFDPAGIYFRYCGEPRILASDVYYDLTLQEGAALNMEVHQRNAINIYIVETLSQVLNDGTIGFFCGTASFPDADPLDRYILLNGSCLRDASLLAHEIGHFYGLYHTHETSFGKELVRRGNCEVAGDLLCDTPADPLLDNSNVIDCRYNGEEVDAEGNGYRPDIKNLMSYSPGKCRNSFTRGQVFRMMAVHRNQNSYLLQECSFPDFAVKIDTFFASFLPGQKVRLPVTLYNLGWPDNYGLEVNAYLSDDGMNKDHLLYRDRIIFPSHRTSISFRVEINLPIDLPESDQFILFEADALQEIFELNENNNNATLAYRLDYGSLADATIYPNPASEKTRLFMRNETKTGKVRIDLLDLAGRRIRTFSREKVFDTFQAELDLTGMTPGIYMVLVSVGDEAVALMRIAIQ